MAAMPAHSRADGSMKMPSRATTCFSQSSRRPTMIVTTGPISEVSCPAASRAFRPRSMASAACTACGTEKDTVTLIETPREVASSMASRPVLVAGIFTTMLRARLWNSSAWSASFVASRWKRGSVCTDRRPLRPLCSSKMGSRSFAASCDMSLTAFQPISDSPQVGFASAMAWMRGAHTSRCFLMVL